MMALSVAVLALAGLGLAGCETAPDRVSIAGLGCGGPSRLGRKTGYSPTDGVALIRRAVELGINFLDTAESYDTEPILGAALKEIPRDRVVLSTKYLASRASATTIVEALDDSLRALGTDYLDIFHLHSVTPKDYDRAVRELVPALQRERERGKFRFLGITERNSYDWDHATLTRAVDEDFWDVIMVAFNLVQPGAIDHVLPQAKECGIGTLIMTPARFRSGTPEHLADHIRARAAQSASPANIGDPLADLLREIGADSLMDAAYRFARHESGADVVLFGTGNVDHLEANIASLLRPPLPGAGIARLTELFGDMESAGRPPPRDGFGVRLRRLLPRRLR
jgi:aryl-alcohol dehydrogenase-like predicted oxidoreductase